MNLFAKEKELIFKIVNGIFLIWFIAALVLSANSIIEFVVREPVPTYREFIDNEMMAYEEKGISDKEIKDMYNQSYGYRDAYALRFIFTSLANVVIVGGAIYILNRQTKKKDENKVEKKEEVLQ